MAYTYCCTASIIGLIAGLLYGLSFVLFQRRVFSSDHTSNIKKYSHLFLVLRILVLMLFGFYLLHSPQIASILVMVLSFVIAFWLVILNKKFFLYE